MNRSPRRPVKGIITLVAGLLLAAFFLVHEHVPSLGVGLGLIVDSGLPWVGLLIIPLGLVALFRRSLVAGAGFMIPAIVWASMFGHQVWPASEPTAETQLTVATQNVGARLPEPTATAQKLVAEESDIVTVQEVTSLSGKIIDDELTSAYNHRQVLDTIGVWSDYPMTEATEVDLGIDWPRAFRTVVSTDNGDVAFYAVHMPSVRPGLEADRDGALRKLSSALAGDESERIILAGDLNAATTDRNFNLLDRHLIDTRQYLGGGFGFTWPAIFPVTRLDHIMVRGFTPQSEQVLSRGTSDHRAIVAGLSFGEPSDDAAANA